MDKASEVEDEEEEAGTERQQFCSQRKNTVKKQRYRKNFFSKSFLPLSGADICFGGVGGSSSLIAEQRTGCNVPELSRGLAFRDKFFYCWNHVFYERFW